MSARPDRAVVIGASAGAVEALSAILPRLPRGFSLPVMIVVHIPPDGHSVLASLFRAKCSVEVREAEDKEPALPGTVYFAPPDYHLLVERDRTLSLANDEPVLFSRPSIDVLFESAADVYGPGLVAVVLTGANQDGAAGASAVARAGGVVIVQQAEEAFVATMPRAAAAACASARALTLEGVATFLQQVEKE